MRLASPAIVRGLDRRDVVDEDRDQAGAQAGEAHAEQQARRGAAGACRDHEPLRLGQLARADLAAELQAGTGIADAAARRRSARAA